MQQTGTAHRPHRPTRIALLVAVAATVAGLLATGAVASPSARGGTVQVVKRAHSKALGRTVLTSLKGRTLYSLSVEKKGTFICTGSCLSAWHPLLVPAGAKPGGPVPLGTVRRPGGGGVQVTYRGRPLYTFKDDTKAGQANGEGIKDVGTWRAAVVPKH